MPVNPVFGEIDDLVGAWLKATLAAHTGVIASASGIANRIYRDVAPQDDTDSVQLAVITFDLQDTTDRRILGPDPLWTNSVYQVKAITPGVDSTSALTIAKAIYAALQAQSGTYSTIRIVSCVRESLVSYSEELDGRTEFQHRGGLYRIQARPL